MSAEIVAQLAVGGMLGAFMWGLKMQLAAMNKSLENHRENMRELYQTKVSHDACRERRELCPGKVKGAA